VTKDISAFIQIQSIALHVLQLTPRRTKTISKRPPTLALINAWSWSNRCALARKILVKRKKYTSHMDEKKWL